jgi:hypothetical protein
MTDQTAPPDDERQTRPFADVLNSLRRGKTHREASARMAELVQAVAGTGKQGSITLTLKVSKSKVSGMVEIDDTVKVKLPEPPRDASMYFADDDGNLTKDDPRQTQLDFGPRAVPTDERHAQ